MAIKRLNAHWRDSGRLPRFFLIDARSAFPLLLFLLHIKLWTFIVALSATIFFGVIEYFGYSAVVFLRLLRAFFAGKRKANRRWWREERFK